MAVSMDKIKELRDRTSVGISDCKKALEESAGDMDKAIEWLQKKGISKAQARGKEAKEGLVHAYVHPGGRIGVLVYVNCNKYFVARTNEFHEFSDDLAMQIAAMRPTPILSEISSSIPSCLLPAVAVRGRANAIRPTNAPPPAPRW